MTKPTDQEDGASGAGLFEELPQPGELQLVQRADAEMSRKRSEGAVRLLQPNRLQVELRASDLESLLPEDHRARLVWGYVVRQDLSKLVEAVKARGSNAGRAAIDPHILFALWLYATLEGVGSGREVTRLSQEHDAYRWICGGVSVNYHAINDFRAGNATLMDELLTDNVAALAAAGAISLERVAQDGMRVRADAGAASFRRQASLQEHLKEAGELVQEIKTQAQADPGQAKRQARAAKLRAAQLREKRIQAALEQLPEVAATKKRNGDKAEDARVSTTDAQARVMKMGDGGFRPAFNVQFATTCQDQVIVGMDVVNAGSDMAQMAPMVEQVQKRLGQSPDQWLVDGGFPAHDQIDAVADKTEVYAPVPEPKTKKDKPGNAVQQDTATDKHQPKAGDSESVASWRVRMGSEEARELYKQRAATAECVNAQARNRGLLRMPVRGLVKVRWVVGLFVLAQVAASRHLSENHMPPFQIRSIAKVLLSLAFGISPAALAQNAREATLVGQPLIYAKEGKLTGCGVRVLAMDEAPIVRSRPVVERAWFRADGLTPTSARDGRMMPTSDPPGGVLYVTSSLRNDMSILLAMLHGKTVEMGAKLKGESGDTVRFGKVVLSEAEGGRVQSCLDDLLASAKAEPGK